MDKQAIIDHINHAIFLLGSMRIRVDDLVNVGVPVSNSIQDLGETIQLINQPEESEEKSNEQEDNN